MATIRQHTVQPDAQIGTKKSMSRESSFFTIMDVNRHLAISAAFIASIGSPVIAAPLSGTGGSVSNAAITGGNVVNISGAGTGLTSITRDIVTFTGIFGTFNIDINSGGTFNVPNGENALFNPGGAARGWTFTFSQPVAAFAFNIGGLDQPWQLSARDTQNRVLETFDVTNAVVPRNSNDGNYIGISSNSRNILSADFLYVGNVDSVLVSLFAYNPIPVITGIVPGTPANASNPYSTTFDGGTLIVDVPGSYSTDYTIDAAGGTIDINGSSSTFSGVFSGTGPLAFSNSGTGGSSNLTSISTYTGATTVGNNTTLFVNGSIASSSGLTVNSGGTIGGSGILPATTIASGGVMAPGNSIGTLTVNGNYSLNGGTLAIELQGPQNDRINVTNNVTNFTGTANLIAFGGGSPWPNFTYTIVNAPNSADFATSNSLTLDQSGVTSALLRAGSNLIQNADGNPKTFDVQWRPTNGTGATASAMQALDQGGVNQIATAGAFDRAFQSLATNAANNANNIGNPIGSTGFTTGQAAAAGLSADFLSVTSQLLALSSNNQLIAAINSLSPEPYAAFQSVGIDTLKRQRELLLSQAGNCRNTGWVVNAPTSKKGKAPKNPLCVFAQAANATSSINGSSGLSSYNSGTFSTFYGIEYQPSKQWTVGASYGYGTSYLNNIALTNALITSEVNSGSLYGVYKPSDRWSIRGLFGYANFNSSGSRNVAFIGNGATIKGSPTGNGYTLAINADYLVNLSKASAKTQTYIKPIVGIAWGGYQQGAFNESAGGPLNLNVQGNTANSLVGTIGFELATSPIALNKSNTTAITPRLAVAYQVDALGNDTGVKSLTSSFQSAPAAGSFVTQGENRGVNALLVDGGVDIKVAQNASLYASVGYEVFSTGSQFTYGGGVKVKF